MLRVILYIEYNFHLQPTKPFKHYILRLVIWHSRAFRNSLSGNFKVVLGYGGRLSHSIDFVGLDEKLFILRHIVHGASSNCATEKIASEDDTESQHFDEYWSRLKGLLGNYLIESAVKARIVHEFCTKNDDDGELAMHEKKALDSLTLGRVI